MVDAIGRAKEDGLHAQGALDEPLRQVQFPFDLRLGSLVELRMRKGMVADFVALGIFAFQDIRRAVGLFSDDKKYSGGFLLFQHVQDFRSPAGIRAVVERQYQLVLGGADLLDVVRKREGVVLFAGKQVGGLVVSEGAAAMFGDVGDTPDVAVAFQNEIRAGSNVGQFVADGIVGARGVPNRPQRSVHGTEAP